MLRYLFVCVVSDSYAESDKILTDDNHTDWDAELFFLC